MSAHGRILLFVSVIYDTLKNVNGKNRLSVERLCDLANVSRSGYYAWLKAKSLRDKREAEDRKDFKLILEAYKKRGYSKGAKSIQMILLHMDPPVNMNLKKIRRLMRKCNLVCPMRKANPYRKITRDMLENSVSDNLV